MVVRQTKEYHKNDSNKQVGEQLNVNHVFVGGVTGDVDTSVLEVGAQNNSCALVHLLKWKSTPFCASVLLITKGGLSLSKFRIFRTFS